MVPVGWHAQAGTESKKGQKMLRVQDTPPISFFVRSIVFEYSQLTIFVALTISLVNIHPSTLGVLSQHLSHPLPAGIVLTSTLCPPPLSSASLPILLFVCRSNKPVPRWHHCSSMEDRFSPTSILILLAPLPMPMPAPAQALTGWHCANLPPPSLSFVAHPYVALPPVSTLPSLSPLLISFIHSFNHLPSAC